MADTGWKPTPKTRDEIEDELVDAVHRASDALLNADAAHRDDARKYLCKALRKLTDQIAPGRTEDASRLKRSA